VSRRGLTLLVAGAFTAVLVILGAVLPVPYVVLLPGPVCDTLGSCYGRTVVTVTGTAAASEPAPSGHLYLTTVGVEPASCSQQPTLFQALRAWFDQTEAVEPQQVICPPGQSAGQVQQQNEQEMSQSQQDATTAALLQLGYRPTSKHIVVTDVEPGTPAAKALRSGDVIQAVDGRPVGSVAALHKLIAKHPVGSRVTMTIRRDGAVQSVSMTTMRVAGRTVVGIDGLDLQATFGGAKVPQVHLGLSPADVGGPSAGLMFTLGIIDKLTPGSLSGGRTVAGTGTIDGFGQVGPIGGIEQKIAAAAAHHATVFLAPAADCADARAAAPKSMTLVRVSTLKGALAALQAIDSGSTAFPRC
jgi:PDZ domain-containing protein